MVKWFWHDGMVPRPVQAIGITLTVAALILILVYVDKRNAGKRLANETEAYVKYVTDPEHSSDENRER